MKNRYSRQIAIAEIGIEGQEKISRAKVLVIGCGALGSMVAMQLAGAGVGHIGLADFDNIDISNLQRQFFFTTAEAGLSKAMILSKKIKELNPEVNVATYSEVITAKKANQIFSDYDFIVDCTDNPESKKMTGEISKIKGKGCCIGGVREFSGQVMTFLKDDPRMEDYFGKATSDGFLPCSLGGVLGPAAAVCASLQASETLKFIVEKGKSLSGVLLLFNLFDNSFHQFRL